MHCMLQQSALHSGKLCRTQEKSSKYVFFFGSKNQYDCSWVCNLFFPWKLILCTWCWRSGPVLQTNTGHLSSLLRSPRCQCSDKLHLHCASDVDLRLPRCTSQVWGWQEIKVKLTHKSQCFPKLVSLMQAETWFASVVSTTNQQSGNA